MTTRIIVIGLFLVLIFATIASLIQLKKVGSSLIDLNKEVEKQRAESIAENERKEISSAELSSAIRARLIENPVSELNIKFAK